MSPAEYNSGSADRENRYSARGSQTRIGSQYDSNDSYYQGIPPEWIPIMCSPDQIGLFEYEGRKVARITTDDHRYERVAHVLLETGGLVDTTLDIFDDMAGRVFVQVTLDMPQRAQGPRMQDDSVYAKSSNGNYLIPGQNDNNTLPERFMVDARAHLQFFEALAEHAILILMPHRGGISSEGEDIVLIQMPRPDKAHDALELIRQGLKMGQNI